jgi:hypothetical protein
MQKFILLLISHDTIYAMGSETDLLIFQNISEACLFTRIYRGKLEETNDISLRQWYERCYEVFKLNTQYRTDTYLRFIWAYMSKYQQLMKLFQSPLFWYTN